MALSKIEQLIADERADLEKQLAEALGDRDKANTRVKNLRDKLDAAPRLHVKRNTKKSSKVTVEGMTAVLTALDASLKADEGNGEPKLMPQLDFVNDRGE